MLAGLRDRGIPSEVFTWKALARRLLPLDKDTLVAGEIPVVIGALKQLGIEPPTPNDYPKCLEPLQHRRVWQSTVRALSDDRFDGSGQPVFAKPLAPSAPVAWRTSRRILGSFVAESRLTESSTTTSAPAIGLPVPSTVIRPLQVRAPSILGAAPLALASFAAGLSPGGAAASRRKPEAATTTTWLRIPKAT